MITTHKVRAFIRVEVAKFGTRDETVTLFPAVVEAKWTRNNHLVADELTVTLSWKESGIDPRAIKNATCQFYLWDESLEPFDENRHLRFTGVGKKAKRRLSENGWVVDITFHDYTTLFINNKPMKTSGMPEWTDTLPQIWARICDNTGWEDPANGKIVSSVEAFKRPGGLIFEVDGYDKIPIGQITNPRFLKVSKPQPKARSSSWDVWQWCIGSLGLISYIDRDVCIVTNTVEHYGPDNASRAIYGENIHSLEESVDTDITGKGILLKSMDPLTGRVLEAFYPPPGDERIKTKRGAFGKKSEGGADVTANEVSGEYEEYFRYDITNQTALDRAAQEAYTERCKQELEGSFHTAETVLEAYTGVDIDILDLRAGDVIRIEMHSELRDWLIDSGAWGSGSAEQVKYIVDRFNYDPDVAELIVRNIKSDVLQSPTFHVKSVEVDYGPEKFDVEIKYHNLITIDT